MWLLSASVTVVVRIAVSDAAPAAASPLSQSAPISSPSGIVCDCVGAQDFHCNTSSYCVFPAVAVAAVAAQRNAARGVSPAQRRPGQQLAPESSQPPARSMSQSQPVGSSGAAASVPPAGPRVPGAAPAAAPARSARTSSTSRQSGGAPAAAALPSSAAAPAGLSTPQQSQAPSGQGTTCDGSLRPFIAASRLLPCRT